MGFHQFITDNTALHDQSLHSKTEMTRVNPDAVTHQPINQAQACLSSVSRREPECSGWYGRKQRLQFKINFLISLSKNLTKFSARFQLKNVDFNQSTLS